LLSAWTREWTGRAFDALSPVAKLMYFEDAPAAMDEIQTGLSARVAKLGLNA